MIEAQSWTESGEEVGRLRPSLELSLERLGWVIDAKFGIESGEEVG